MGVAFRFTEFGAFDSLVAADCSSLLVLLCGLMYSRMVIKGEKKDQ